ncbi:unnamed protein product, partial [Effrenium voratum]
VEAVAASLGSNIAKLDLSANCFDCKGMQAIISFVRRASRLTDVNLSGNKLMDAAVSQLCLHLQLHCPFLDRLSLADVQMGRAASGQALGSLVGMRKLRFLDVSFNTLHGQGAVELLKSLASSRLRCLDVSWNCLGKGSQSKAVAEELSSVFQRLETLQHLDLSFNNFQPQEVGILAQGLATNRTLWGLHMDGSGTLDADGFLSAFRGLPEPASEPRPKTSRNKKAKAKGKQPKKEEEHPGQLSPQELEARLQALQWQIRLQDMAQEYQQKAELEERKQVEEQRKQRQQLLLLDESDSRMPVSLPELIRRLKPGDPLSPRSQGEMLHSLALEVKPELTALLRDRAKTRNLHLHTKENILNSNCWICGEWVEVLFELAPGDFPEKPAEEDPVCILMCLDNFSRPTPLTAQSDGVYRGSRFLPPCERCFLALRVGQTLGVHPRLPVRSLQRPLLLPLQGTQRELAEVNVLRVGALAEAPMPGCRLLRTAAEAASFSTSSKLASAHPRQRIDM